MTKKQKSTYDTFVESLSSQEKKEFEQEYKDLLLSEMVIAIMEKDDLSVRELAKAAGISPTIVQGIRAGTRKNVSVQSFFKILSVLGYNLIAERNGSRFLLDLSHTNKP